MRALITGMNGTVAPIVAKVLEKNGYAIVPYDRTRTSTEDEEAIRDFLKTTKPELLMHFAMGSNEWTRMLAKLTQELGIKYVYISSVSVYSAKQPAPFTKNLIPEPDDDYGTYKFEGEKASQAMNPESYIARLSWQIGHDKTTNNMIAQLFDQMNDKGFIEASDAFYPSAAFMEDTAQGLLQMLHHPPGIYHLNTNESLSFYEIVHRLKTLYPTFKVKRTKTPAIDVRMKDEALDLPLLEDTINGFSKQ